MLRRRIHRNVAMFLPACAKITTEAGITTDHGQRRHRTADGDLKGPADPLLKHRFPR